MEPTTPNHSEYHMPPLTDEFLYQIIFCMEDQSNQYCLDLKEGILCQVGFVEQRRQEDPQRFLAIPEWFPSDGFRTMEKFVSTLRNPVYREQLREVLQSGKGVFRQFKDVLHGQPALERLWYYYKDKEIRRRIYLWYETHDEVCRLSRLGEAPEDGTDELIKEDFLLTGEASSWMEAIQRVGGRLVSTLRDTGRQIDSLVAQQLEDAWRFQPEDQFLVALSNTGLFAGFICYHVMAEGIVDLRCFGVEEEFQGLGLFRYLFTSLCGQLATLGLRELVVTLGADALRIEHMFELVCPVPILHRMTVSIPRWCDQTTNMDPSDFV